MSVVAWDGNILAADRQTTQGGLTRTTSKIKRLANNKIVAFDGALENGLALMQWYESGADPDKWPNCQIREQWAELIIADESGVISYEQHPIPIRTFDPFNAFGSGSALAIGAMAMGANAVEAVEIASRFHRSCGHGVEWYEIKEQDKQTVIGNTSPQIQSIAGCTVPAHVHGMEPKWSVPSLTCPHCRADERT